MLTIIFSQFSAKREENPSQRSSKLINLYVIVDLTIAYTFFEQYEIAYSLNTEYRHISHSHCLYTVYCTVGWADFRLFCIFKRNIAEICARPSKRMENAKNIFLVIWPLAQRSWYFGSCTIERPKNFFHNVGFMGIKSRRFERRFQKYKLV
jgi:hypothetical protein